MESVAKLRFRHTDIWFTYTYIDTDIAVNIIYSAWTHRHVKRTELPSGTITSDEVSSLMKSGGMTTSRKPICKKKRIKTEDI